MTYRKQIHTVSAASWQALNNLVAYWESRKWQRIGRPSVCAGELPGSAIWTQEMECSEVPAGPQLEASGARDPVVWFA